MSNNSLAMASTLVKKCFKVENISVSPFCTKLSQTAGYFLNASVLFLSAKILVQIPCIELVQMAKYIRQIRNWHILRNCHFNIYISTSRISANEEFLSLEKWLFLP